ALPVVLVESLSKRAVELKRALRGEFPAFVFHFAIGPMLEFFEEGGFDYGEADTDAAFVADPHQAGFGLEEDFAFWKDETYIEQSGETQGIFDAVEPHAAG